MNGHFETGGIYPLSTEPAEGYGGDPAERSGEAILIHAPTGKFLQLNDGEQGYTLVTERNGATRFPDHSVASIAASKLIQTARDAQPKAA